MSAKTKIRGAVVIDITRCKGCGICIVSCPHHVLKLSEEVNAKGYCYAYSADGDKCTGCANCGIICPDGVIEVYKKKTEE